MKWFEVDTAGLAAMLTRKGKAFALFELVQNAWDSGASRVEVLLTPVAGSPFATIVVQDNSPEGWANLDDAFTIFGKSSRAADPVKRGRFCMGEKLVIALCRSVTIETMQGSVIFSDEGRRRTAGKTSLGTRFTGELRLTRDELAEVVDAASRLIPPIPTEFNGKALDMPTPVKTFSVRLPTEVADGTGAIRKTTRETVIEVFPSPDGEGEVLEMGIPVCSGPWPWRLNVLQKVPMGMDRDSVTDAFRRSLQVAAMNAMAPDLSAEDAAKPWASEAIGDGRVSPEALGVIVQKRFGDRVVVASPGDPMSNAAAEASGCTVIHGGSLSADAWANIRKHALVPSSAQAFPSPKPIDQSGAAKCPTCGKPV